MLVTVFKQFSFHLSVMLKADLFLNRLPENWWLVTCTTYTL